MTRPKIPKQLKQKLTDSDVKITLQAILDDMNNLMSVKGVGMVDNLNMQIITQQLVSGKPAIVNTTVDNLQGVSIIDTGGVSISAQTITINSASQATITLVFSGITAPTMKLLFIGN